MKKIINGKLYDTQTAELVCDWTQRMYNDLGYVYYALYRSPRGRYFVYSARNGHADLELLTRKKAKKWNESCLLADEYIRVFGTPEEG